MSQELTPTPVVSNDFACLGDKGTLPLPGVRGTICGCWLLFVFGKAGVAMC